MNSTTSATPLTRVRTDLLTQAPIAIASQESADSGAQTRRQLKGELGLGSVELPGHHTQACGRAGDGHACHVVLSKSRAAKARSTASTGVVPLRDPASPPTNAIQSSLKLSIMLARGPGLRGIGLAKSSFQVSPDGELVRTFAILTTAANATMQTLHERMPVILEPDAWSVWLDGDPGRAADLMRPAPDRHDDCCQLIS